MARIRQTAARYLRIRGTGAGGSPCLCLAVRNQCRQREFREAVQHGHFVIAEPARLSVHVQEGAERTILLIDEGQGGIESDGGLAGNERVFRKSGIEPRIGDDLGLVLLDGMGAE